MGDWIEKRWYNYKDPQAYRENKHLSKKENSARKKRLAEQAKKLARQRNIEFYESREWRELRYRALKAYGRRCMCCGATPEGGAVMHVDHIKPRSKYPKLALVISNLQILCGACNEGKGAWDQTDFRPK